MLLRGANYTAPRSWTRRPVSAMAGGIARGIPGLKAGEAAAGISIVVCLRPRPSASMELANRPDPHGRRRATLGGMSAEIRRVGVVGAGTMGNGIAQAFAQSGDRGDAGRCLRCGARESARDDRQEPGQTDREGQAAGRRASRHASSASPRAPPSTGSPTSTSSSKRSTRTSRPSRRCSRPSIG